MRIILITNIVLSIVLGCFIFIQVPLIKMPTKTAFGNIEQRFLRIGLNDKEKKNYEWLKGLIFYNIHQDNFCRRNSWISGLVLATLLLLNNILIFRIIRNKSNNKNNQPKDTANL